MPGTSKPELTQASPFAHYQPKVGKTSGGKQKKAAGTGFYKRDNKTYYIKKSEKFPADDIAEIVTAGLGRSILELDGNECLFAECAPTQHVDGSIFVRSTCTSGWKPLYKHSYGSNFFLDRLRSLRDKKTYQIVEKLTGLQKEQLAKILAICLWLGEYDCGTQNIGIDDDGNIVKIDHGWGLVSLCRPQHTIVRLFETKAMLGARGTHRKKIGLIPIPSGIPTNHFNDFKYLIKTPYFTHALREITTKIKNQITELPAIVAIQFETILTAYKHQGIKAQMQALLDFAAHLKLEIPKELDTQIRTGLTTEEIVPITYKKTLDDLQALITTKLTERLIERSKSMELLGVLLESKIKLKILKQSKTIIPQIDIIDMLKQIKKTIDASYHNPNLNIDNILTESSHKMLITILSQLKETIANKTPIANVKELAYIIAFYKRICIFSKHSEYFNLLKTIEEQGNLALQFSINAKEASFDWQPPEELLAYKGEANHTTMTFKPAEQESSTRQQDVRQEMNIHNYNAFPPTKEGHRKWTELKNQFRCYPGFREEKHKFVLTEEKITVLRHTNEQACAITTTNPNYKTIKTMAKIAHAVGKLTNNSTVVIRRGANKDIVTLYQELDKLTEPKLTIQLSETLLQNDFLIDQLKQCLPHFNAQ